MISVIQWFESFIKIIDLVVVAFTKKKKKENENDMHISIRDRAAGRVNTKAFNEYISICTRILLFLSFLLILSHGESKSTASYVLLSANMMSTSNIEYE